VGASTIVDYAGVRDSKRDDQAISLRGVHMLQVRDGLIRRSEDYWDAATFQRQLNPVHERS
jgi:ketosteroid isomerase-like protein